MTCFKSSPPEEFYYKGFLQICSKFIGEHPHKNLTSETYLNGQVMLLKGAFLFHPCIMSRVTTSLWLHEPDCFVEVNMYQRESRNEYCKRKLRSRKNKIRRLQVCYMSKINK